MVCFNDQPQNHLHYFWKFLQYIKPNLIVNINKFKNLIMFLYFLQIGCLNLLYNRASPKVKVQYT